MSFGLLRIGQGHVVSSSSRVACGSRVAVAPVSAPLGVSGAALDSLWWLRLPAWRLDGGG